MRRTLIRPIVLVCALSPLCACNNGGATPLSDAAPTPPAHTPSVTVTSVTPAAGATPFFTVAFTLAARPACGQGLLVGGALTLDDGTIQDSADANGYSGFGSSPVDAACSQSGISAAQLPQRGVGLDNVLHVKAITMYLSPPIATIDQMPYPAISSAVMASRYATDLYMVAEPLGATAAGPVAVGGSWSGTVQDTSGGAGSAALSIRQSGTQLLGTWSFDFGKSGPNTSGTVVGYDFQSVVTLLLTRSDASCPLVWRMNLAGGSAGVQSTYAPAFGCSLTSAGTASISRTP